MFLFCHRKRNTTFKYFMPVLNKGIHICLTIILHHYCRTRNYFSQCIKKMRVSASVCVRGLMCACGAEQSIVRSLRLWAKSRRRTWQTLTWRVGPGIGTWKNLGLGTWDWGPGSESEPEPESESNSSSSLPLIGIGNGQVTETISHIQR